MEIRILNLARTRPLLRLDDLECGGEFAGSLPSFEADLAGRFDGSDLDRFGETVVDLGEFQMRSSVERPGVKMILAVRCRRYL